MTAPWWSEPVRFFQHLLREEDAVGLDPARLIGEARALGARAYISMGGGFSAWYPTRLRSQRINPHLQGDFLGDVIAAARSADVKSIVRMDISKGRPEWLGRDPGWFVRNPDGSARTVWEMPLTCATGPVWQVECFSVLEEILSRYAVDGFFFNYFSVPRCYCERCRALVREATGADVPDPEIRTPVYERWRRAVLAEQTRRIRASIQSRQPEAILIPYHHVRDGWDVRDMAELSDVVGAQVSNPLVVNPVDPQPQWAHWAAEEALLARAVKPGSAPVLIQSASAFFASRQTAMPTGRTVRNLVQAAAHRANTAPVLNGTLDQDDPRTVPGLLGFARYQEANAGWYRGLTSLAQVALVRSQDSIDWGLDGGRPAGDPRKPGHVAEFRGLYEIVAGLRYPCDVLAAGGLRARDLERYRAVILPAVSCLNAADVDALDRYAEAGGTLIATADLGACDAEGLSRTEPALASFPALPGKSQTIAGGYFALQSEGLRASLGGIPHIGADGDLWVLDDLEPGRAGVDLRLIGPFGNNAPEFTTVQGPGTLPGLWTFNAGRGLAVWLPWRIGALYHLFGIPDYAGIIAHFLGRAAGDPPVRSEAPAVAEFILYGHPAGEVLHILNGAASQGKPLVDTVRLAGFTVRVRSPAPSAVRLDDGCAIPLKRDGAEVVFQIDHLDTFAAVALVHEGDSVASIAPGP